MGQSLSNRQHTVNVGITSTTVSGNSSKRDGYRTALFWVFMYAYTTHVWQHKCVCVEVKGHSPVLFFKRHPPWVSFVVLCFWRPRWGVLLVCTLPSRLYYPAREPQKFSCPCLFSAGITCVYHHTLRGFKGQTHVRTLARAFYHLSCLPRPKELSSPYN